jgi:uncharacterized protein YciI
MYYCLFYDYVDNALEKRTPFRPGHLNLVKDFQAQGKLILAGAYNDPLDGALLIFKAESPLDLENFVEQDPYVKNGLVTNWKIRAWNVVAGNAFSE